MTPRVIGYWTTTTILAAALLSGGVAQLMQQPETLKGMMLLGYPAYFVGILGFWKILGAVALLAPRFPRVKEWAYAGVFFEMTGAAASHAIRGNCGMYAFHFIVPTTFAALAVASWALRPPTRRPVDRTG